MRFSIAAVLAFATATLAQVDGFHVITHPQKGEKLAAGSTYEIIWQPNAEYPGEVTIGLLGGASPKTLSVVDTIAKDIDGADGIYNWKIPTTLGDMATYGVMITLESDESVFQYGFPFQIVSSDDSDDKEEDDSSSTTTSTATETESSSSSTKTKTSTVTSTTFSVSSSATITSSTVPGNLSTTASHTTITSVVTGGASTTTTATSTIATNGVASVAAGGFAMLGGVAVAVLAL